MVGAIGRLTKIKDKPKLLIFFLFYTGKYFFFEGAVPVDRNLLKPNCASGTGEVLQTNLDFSGEKYFACLSIKAVLFIWDADCLGCSCHQL